MTSSPISSSCGRLSVCSGCFPAGLLFRSDEDPNPPPRAPAPRLRAPELDRLIVVPHPLPERADVHLRRVVPGDVVEPDQPARRADRAAPPAVSPDALVAGVGVDDEAVDCTA